MLPRVLPYCTSPFPSTQSVLPLMLEPRRGALKSSLRKGRPLLLLWRPRNHDAEPSMRPKIQPIVRYGCSEKVTRMSKNIFSKLEIVSFGLSFGGCAVTLLRVSRIEVRDGTIWLPVLVWSQ